ncbi:MAG: hypothetical protein ACKVOK_03775 [Flavobacteriales bacterium]
MIADTNVSEIPSHEGEVKAFEWDSLNFDSVKINGNIPLKLSVKSLIEILGQPDSTITEHGWDCGNYLDDLYSVTVYYYGKSRFISSGGEALLHEIYFSDNRLSFGTRDFKISSEISEAELKLLFPKSYTTMLEQIRTDKQYGERSLSVDMVNQPLNQEGSAFIFYFENGKLSRIELWWFIC